MDDPNLMNLDSPPTVEIKVNWQGAEGTLVVPLSARIIEVKLLILQIFSVPIAAERQELTWDGKFLKDQLTVQSYNIPANATIHVFKKIKVGIYLVTNSLSHEVVVYDGTSVGALKAKIHADFGVDIKDKILRKDNYDLDDRTNLWSAGVVEGTWLHLVRKK